MRYLIVIVPFVMTLVGYIWLGRREKMKVCMGCEKITQKVTPCLRCGMEFCKDCIVSPSETEDYCQSCYEDRYGVKK